MVKPNFTIEDLRRAVEADAPRQSVKQLFDYCHAMATAYTRLKVAAGTLKLDRLGLKPEDAALDAIADLFRRNDDGVYPAFENICRSTPGRSLSLHDDLRRLVFGSVNQFIFRSYRETDPGLARLIRNIKFTLKHHADAQLLRLNDELLIAPKNPELLPQLPMMAEELLRIEFWNSARFGFSVREFLSTLAVILNDQSLYRRMYPVTAFALLVRPAYQDRTGAIQSTDGGSESYDEDIKTVAAQVVAETTASLLESYGLRGKLAPNDARAYENAVADILCETFLEGNGNATTYFEALERYIPGLTKAEYTREHRTRLEYAAKQAKEAMRIALQKEFSFSARTEDRNDGEV